jgi:hypothetical protein
MTVCQHLRIWSEPPLQWCRDCGVDVPSLRELSTEVYRDVTVAFPRYVKLPASVGGYREEAHEILRGKPARSRTRKGG